MNHGLLGFLTALAGIVVVGVVAASIIKGMADGQDRQRDALWLARQKRKQKAREAIEAAVRANTQAAAQERRPVAWDVPWLTPEKRESVDVFSRN